jgi:hypothetical protein
LVLSRPPSHELDAFRADFITYLSDKLGLPAELVTSKLGDWLLDSDQHQGPGRGSAALGKRPRT